MWQLLHPKHFVNVLLIHHMGCSREKEIIDVAAILKYGLNFNKKNSSDNDSAFGCLEYIATHNKLKETSESIKTNNIVDIFQPLKNSGSSTTIPNFILIEGAPGMGKTTLCKEIAYQWAKQCLLKDTKLLFLFYLRDPAISNIISLKDFIHYFYTFDQVATELSERCAGIINDRDGEELTILFDGFDEFDSSSNSLVSNILDRKVLPQCRIVVTSRLTASDRLRRMADVKVQVMGFTDESKIQYIKQELKDYPDKINKLQSYLNDHESIKSICYIPMMMTILVYVFKEKGQLPNNLTDLYNKFVALTISHHSQKQKKSEHLYISLQTLPEEYRPFLNDLSKFAFLSLHSKKKVFSKEDIKILCPNSLLDISDLERLGLLISVQYFCTDKGHTSVFNFLHLSIHEYLAAYYINSVDQNMQFNKLENTFLNRMYQETWNMFINMNNRTWQNFQNYTIYFKDAYNECLSKWLTKVEPSSNFLECISKLCDNISMNTISNNIVQILFVENYHSCNIKTNVYQEHTYLSLSNTNNVHQTTLELFVIDKVKKDLYSHWLGPLQNINSTNRLSTVFYNKHFLLLDRVNQEHVVNSFKFKTLATQCIILVSCRVSVVMIDVLKQFDFKSLLHFQVVNCIFELNALTNILSSLSNLLTIILRSTKLSAQEVNGISSVILNSHNLQILDLSNNHLHNDIIKLTKALKHTRTLKVLNLTNNNIPQSAVTAINAIIRSNASLKMFCIGNNNLGSSMVAILESLCRISSLQKLQLHNNRITEEASEALASVILHNRGLQELHLSGNNLGEGLSNVMKALQHVTSLTALDLGDNNITKEVSCDLAHVIKSNMHLEKLSLHKSNLKSLVIPILQSLGTISTLKYLNFNNNQMTEGAGETLASVILHNTGLEELHLSDNNLGEGLSNVMKALQRVTSLRALDLGDNNVTKEVSCDLAHVIKSNMYLEKLSLRKSNLKSLVIPILQSLITISTLKILNINDNQISKEAGEALASVILHNTGLKELHLSGNNLGKGMLIVAKALEHISSLRSLDVGNNNISKEVANKLALAISANENLEEVRLYDSKLSSSATVILQSLGTISTLKYLNINNNQITEEAGEALASVVMHNAGLEELHLSGNNLGEGMLIVSKALEHISTLRSLDMGNNNISKEVAGKLALTISANENLEEVRLYDSKLSSSATVILQSLGTISTLKYLNFNNNQMTEEAGEALASVILHNTGLEKLHLRDNNLGERMLIVVKALEHISSLRSLDMGNNNISKEVADKLTLAISANENLEEVRLYDSKLSSSATVILQSLGTISTLKYLNINNNQITEEAGEALASVVMHNAGLEELHLSGNNLGEGMLIVSKALEHISTLRSLDMGNNNISKEVAGKLALAISANENLEEVRLYDSKLSSSATVILQSLGTISTLKYLNFNNNQMTEEAGEALASVILHNTGLEKLHLRDNNLGERMLIVVKALEHISSLRSLDMGNNNISKEVADKLTLAISANENLEEVRLYDSKLSSSATVILQSLGTISTLKYLNINNNQITEEAGEALASVVMHNAGLEELHLSGNNLGEGMLIVSKALEHISTLRSLDMGNNNISKEVAGKLALAISANENLEEIRLYDSKLSSSAIVILQSLGTISTLKYLNFNNNQMTEDAGEALASLILYNTGLEELHLRDNNLGEGTLKVLKGLQHITSLKLLDLKNNGMPKEASGELALALTSNKHLEKLWLANNNLQSSAFVILQALSTISSLKCLDMNNNQISGAGGEMLASVINNNTRLRKLYFSNNNIQYNVMKISEALQCNATIESLDLSCNISLTRQSDKLAVSNNSHIELQIHNNLQSPLITILRALHSNTKLRLLKLFSNVITEEAGNLLASVILRNTNLKYLSLNLLAVPLKVTEALQNLSALKSLTFDTCNISEAAESKIALVITNNKSLTRLSLENINLSQNVIRSITDLSNLTTLWLGDVPLSEEMCDDLSLAISKNTSMKKLILLDNMLQTGLIKIAEACNKLSNIHVLQLAHNCIIPSKVVELTSIITQSTSLETVLLGGITLNAAECFHNNINEVLLKPSCEVSFNDCTYLEVIYLEMLRKQIDNNKKCSDNFHIYLNAKNFSFAQKIHHYFKNNRITQMNVRETKEKLKQINTKKMISSLYILEKVKVIDLENNNIDEDVSFELAKALHSNKVLEQLWLRGNKLNTAGALYILNSLEYLTTLQVLDMSYNNIGSQSADGIAAVIDNNPLINQLWLDGNDLHSTGTITICNALKKIRRLSILSLCNNGISGDAADELSAVITQNVLLEDLLLSNNQLHSTGIKVIAKSLSKLIKLRKLDLFNNNIGKEGASSLAIVIHNSPTLQDLFLSGNNLETSGALEICNALSYINSLHVLTLSNNNISDEVTSELIEVLNNNHLYALLIGGNGLECGGLKIAQVIGNDNIAMQLLDFSNNNISEQDKEKIKELFSNRASFKLYV